MCGWRTWPKPGAPRFSEIQKWCGCPWATRISNFTCPPKIHHQQIFDEQQQQIIWSVCPVDNWRVAGTYPQLWSMCPGRPDNQFQKPCPHAPNFGGTYACTRISKWPPFVGNKGNDNPLMIQHKGDFLSPSLRHFSKAYISFTGIN
jgi:hypothetical protein